MERTLLMKTVVVEELPPEIRELVEGWIDGRETIYILRKGEPYAVFHYRESEEDDAPTARPEG